MSAQQVLTRRGRYADSVTLLQVSQSAKRAAGVEQALVAMATELNLQLLAGMGFEAPAAPDPNDLLIAIRAADQDALAAAVELVEQLLQAPAGGRGAGPDREQPPRTIGSAAATGGPGLALISVPGQHAFTEAMDALQHGCDVLVFSDNVSVQQEIALKDAAAERGLLVMGPDCGTAVLDGVGLGFSHTLNTGPVGVVAASGTGAQQVLCLLDEAGVGVSAALGVGGRDLSEPVAGRSTLAALNRLDADPGTELILVVSKPPAGAVAERVQAAADELATEVRFALLGPGQPDLTAAVEQALRALGVAQPRWPALVQPGSPVTGTLVGLFCGGTLCDEAMLIASREIGPINSNIPLEPAWLMADPLTLQGNCMIDFGDDALTRGRPHPMIDPSLRDQQLRAALADPATGVVLLDVVLGHGAHPDPAAELIPILDGARVPVVISVIGAGRDPQDTGRTRQRLYEAGASVFASNAGATRHAVSLIAGAP